MNRRLRYLVALLATLAMLSVLAGSTPRTTAASGDALFGIQPCAPGTRADDHDCDGLPDQMEQALANRFAPVIYVEHDESNYPVSVDWFLQRANLQIHENCSFPSSDRDDDIATPVGSQADLIGSSPYTAPYTESRDCTDGSSISTLSPDPSGSGYGDDFTFVMPDLDGSQHIGSTDPSDWVTYFHAYPAAGGGVILQYWHAFAYNDLEIAGFGAHGGDWDATIHVHLDQNLKLVGVDYSRHEDDHPGDLKTPDALDAKDQVHLYQGTHPLMAIDGGGHAAFASYDDYSDFYGGIVGRTRNPSQIVWTDNPDDVESLTDYHPCAVAWVCHTDHASGIIWKTWDTGQVEEVNTTCATQPICADMTTHLTFQPGAETDTTTAFDTLIRSGAHGGLVNLGEYNPCGKSLCGADQQASDLLAGQFHPLNGQYFIGYNGHWGSLGDDLGPISGTTGPRGPVFQGFDNVCVHWIDPGHVFCDQAIPTYTAWYNSAADAPVVINDTGWAVPPSSQLTLGQPAYTGSAGTFVSGATQLTLTGTQNSFATQIGGPSPALLYCLRLAAAPACGPAQFSSYSAPISVPGGVDASYVLEYYAVDALANEETHHTQPLKVVASAPSTSLGLTGPSAIGSDGATYLSSRTPLTLTASQPGAPGLPATTEFRFYPAGSSAPAFQSYGAPFTISGSDGAYTVDFRSSDALGHQESTQTRTVQLLNTPPSTSASTSDLTVTDDGVTYADEHVLIGLGVTQPGPLAAPSTFYRIYPTGSPSGSFIPYGVPFALPAPDGAYTVEYYSQDALGNQEPARSLALTRDTSAPAITLGQPADGATYVHSDTLTLSYGADDEGGSGVARLDVAIDGQATLGGQTLQNGSQITLLTALPLGQHTVSVVAVDRLGHQSSQTHSFTIIVTPDSISADVDQFLASGSINNAGEANSLRSKLAAAASAATVGNCTTATNQYQAFLREVSAQTGKSIDRTAASILSADAQYVIGACH